MKDWRQLGFSEGFNSRLDYIICYYWITMGVCWIVILLCSYFLWVCLGSLNYWPIPEWIRLRICIHIKNNEKLESSYVLFFIFLGVLLAVYAYQTLYHVEAPVVGGYSVGVIAIGHQWYWSYEYTLSAPVNSKILGLGNRCDYESHAVRGGGDVEIRALFPVSEVISEFIAGNNGRRVWHLLDYIICFMTLSSIHWDCDLTESTIRGEEQKILEGVETLNYFLKVYNDAGFDFQLPAELESEERVKAVGHSFYKGRVDNVIRLPYGKSINLRCTSEDVIHGFRVPGLGIKIDCIPGRINTNKILEAKSGVYFGQCHALCGTHHSSIPIRVDLISRWDFARWLRREGDNKWLS